MGRAKTTGRDLPPGLYRRRRKRKNGGAVDYYFHATIDESGNRKEIPLGKDKIKAIRLWADSTCVEPGRFDRVLMSQIFDEYVRRVLPRLAARTQKDYLEALKQLRLAFDRATAKDVKPYDIADYRDNRTAKVRANRELSLLKTIFKYATEWGYFEGTNPCESISKNKEKPRSYYAEDDAYDLVYSFAERSLRDAMDLAYATGQRQADVLSMKNVDIVDGHLHVKQQKTRARLRIPIKGADGNDNELGRLLSRIENSKPGSSNHLLITDNGEKLTKSTLTLRFNKARKLAAKSALGMNNPELASRIEQFQFRDIRPKSASETDLEHAQNLLGHTSPKMTRDVYRRKGETVMPQSRNKSTNK